MDENKKQMEYKLAGIRVLSLNYDDKNFTPDSMPKQSTFELQTKFAVSKKDKGGIIYNRTKCFNGEEKEQLLFSIEIAVTFQIVNFNDYYDEKKDVFKLPNNFVILFTSLTLSTLRGILFSKLQGTLFQNILLPIVVPSQLAPIDRNRDFTEIDFAKNKSLKINEMFTEMEEKSLDI